MTGHYEFEQWVTVFSDPELAHVREVALVLESRAVPNRLERHGSVWTVIVPVSLVGESRVEVAAWVSENSRPAGGERTLRALGSGWPGVAAWLLALLAVSVFSTRHMFDVDWYAAGSADAGAIVAGEIWRALTALMLHADTVHLLGNLAFGSFFGFYCGKYLGEGFGWCLIVTGGVIGNLLNAWVQVPEHRSVGASTAVFAALGILAAYRWRRGFEPHTSWRVRFAPLYAGIALLAFTGTAGEATDLGAHLFGFLSGLLLGVTATAFAERIGPRTQWLLGGGCLAACWLAWSIALSA